MNPLSIFPFGAAALAVTFAAPAMAATVTLGFSAELTAQQNARYQSGAQDDEGNPLYDEYAGLYSGYAVGDVLAGALTLSGSEADLLALFGAGGGDSWNNDGVSIDCAIGSVSCGTEEWHASFDLIGADVTSSADWGDTFHHFAFSLAGSTLDVAQILGSFGALDVGENDYRASFRLFDFSVDAAEDGMKGTLMAATANAALTPVPVPASLPLVGLGIAALGTIGRRRRR